MVTLSFVCPNALKINNPDKQIIIKYLNFFIVYSMLMNVYNGFPARDNSSLIYKISFLIVAVKKYSGNHKSQFSSHFFFKVHDYVE